MCVGAEYVVGVCEYVIGVGEAAGGGAAVRRHGRLPRPSVRLPVRACWWAISLAVNGDEFFVFLLREGGD